MYPESIKEATGAVIAGATVSASAFVVENFTHSHLNASLLTMKLAKKIEDNMKGFQSDTTKEYYKMIGDCTSYSASSIISAVAALESNISEILFCKELEGYLEDIEESNYRESDYFNENYTWFNTNKNRKKSVLCRLKSTSSVIAKYEIIAILLYGEPLCREEQAIIKDAEYLIKIRNALIHFWPEVEAELMGRSFELKKHAEIRDSKENRFSYSPFFGEEYVSFRNSMIHAGSAEWAYNTAKDFIGFYNETIMSKWTK